MMQIVVEDGYLIITVVIAATIAVGVILGFIWYVDTIARIDY